MSQEELNRNCVHEPERAGARGRIARKSVLFAFCALLSLLIGCYRTNPLPPPTAPPVVGYIVGAPDVLLISILPDPVIEREVRVRPDGKISIDLVGDIQAAGRSPVEIGLDIQQAIGRFKRDAAVNVTVVSSPSQFVTVFGEVGRPGIFPLDTETRVSEAIGRVGGARPFASLGNVILIRTTGVGTKVIKIHLGHIQKGDLSTNFVVRKGDLIVVPPTILAKIGYAMQMLFFPFQPLLSGAATAGSIYSGYDSAR